MKIEDEDTHMYIYIYICVYTFTSVIPSRKRWQFCSLMLVNYWLLKFDPCLRQSSNMRRELSRMTRMRKRKLITRVQNQRNLRHNMAQPSNMGINWVKHGDWVTGSLGQWVMMKSVLVVMITSCASEM